MATTLTTEQEKFTRKYSFSALFLGPFFFYLANGMILRALTAFIPFYNIYVWFHGFFRGKMLAWKYGEWASFESYKKRQVLLSYLTVGFYSAMLLLGIAVGGMLFVTFAPVKTTITSFISNIEQNDAAAAYHQLSETLQQEGSIEEFDKEFVQQSMPLLKGSYRFSSWEMQDNQAMVRVVITQEDGTVVPVDFGLTYENTVWKISSIMTVQGQFDEEGNVYNGDLTEE